MTASVGIKGILLAGGSGTRLRPMTAAVNKHLLPVYDKPMIFYPLATLMSAGIRDILFITAGEDRAAYEALFGHGRGLGMNFFYAVQKRPEGIAQALLIAGDFIQGGSSALALGDNIFHGSAMPELLQRAVAQSATGATVFATEVKDPQNFGIVSFDENGKAIRIVEKPIGPRSNWAVTGLYFYDKRAVELAKEIEPSARGELEISSLNQAYIEEGALTVEKLPEGTAWLDTGTPDSLLEAASFVKKQQAGGEMVACIEEIAYRQGFISRDAFMARAKYYEKTPYGAYIAARAESEYAEIETPEIEREAG